MTVNQTVDKFETDVRTFWQKFRANIVYWWHYATAWVNAVWLSVMAYWALLDKTDKMDLVGSFIGPKWVTFSLLVSGIVANIIAKGWPQPVLAEKVEVKQAVLAAKVADAGDTLPAK